MRNKKKANLKQTSVRNMEIYNKAGSYSSTHMLTIYLPQAYMYLHWLLEEKGFSFDVMDKCGCHDFHWDGGFQQHRQQGVKLERSHNTPAQQRVCSKGWSQQFQQIWQTSAKKHTSIYCSNLWLFFQVEFNAQYSIRETDLHNFEVCKKLQ